MRWCTLSFDKKGIFVYWSWCNGVWSDDFDYGESYDLAMQFDWWAKSWSEAKEDFDNTSPSFIMPFFMAYLFLGVQTLVEIIRLKNMPDPGEQEREFFRTHIWDGNDWVLKESNNG